jgi:parallel beta-helix repeat protein
MIPNRKAVIEMTIGLVVMAGTVQAATFINTCPTVITSPGDYLLSADLICGGGDGITINSSNVTLKLERHRITAGVGANRAIAVNVGNPPPGRSNIHILGPGLITNGGGNTFSAGISLAFAFNSEVSGITVLGSPAGISTGDCTNLTITANTFGRNGLGISLVDSNATISDNDASGNGTGIFVDDDRFFPPTGTVSHNVLNGNTGVGLSISIATGLTVQNNVINGNGQSGILVSEFARSEVINNTSLANGMFDLFDGALGCSGHVWSGNTFFTANQSCIH